MIIKPSNALVNNEKFEIPSNYFDPNTGFEDIECNNGNIEKCVTSLNKEMILWGDSYVMHLAHAIESSKKKITFSQVTKNSCSPILEISNTFKNISFADECIEFNNRVYESIIKNKHIKIILMSSTFNFDTRSTIKFDKNYLTDFSQEFIASKLLNTVRLLESYGKKVVLVSPAPSIGNRSDLGKCSIKVLKRNMPIDSCDFSKRSFSKKTINGYSLLESIEDEINIVWLEKLICNEKSCSPFIDGKPIYRDNGHLSNYGSKYLGQKYNFNEILLNEIKINSEQ